MTIPVVVVPVAVTTPSRLKPFIPLGIWPLFLRFLTNRTVATAAAATTTAETLDMIIICFLVNFFLAFGAFSLSVFFGSFIFLLFIFSEELILPPTKVFFA